MPWAGFRRGFFTLQNTHPARNAVAEMLALLPANAATVDLGAGGRRITPTTVTVDGDATTHPDVLCDLHEVPLEDGRFDGAFCTGTLEHVLDPLTVGRELVRILRPGGVAYIDVPFLQGCHADPHDYRRWTVHGVRRLCHELGLEEITAGAHFGPGSSLCWIATEYVRAWLGTGLLGRGAAWMLRLLLRPILWADRFIVDRPGAQKIASGVFVIARKPARA